MREIDPSHVKETSCTCSLVILGLKDRAFDSARQSVYRVFTFVYHDASRGVSCGMLTKVCKARIYYLKLSCFLHYQLTV